MKLNLGAGDRRLDGYVNLDHKHGDEIFPLPPTEALDRRAAYESISPGSIDEIRASHVLEHFPSGEIAAVLADWVGRLKPGGVLKIAVPDFAKVAEGYLGGANQPTEGYVMGGQVDADDYHKSLFDEQRLKLALAGAGLVLIRRWRSEIDDCASLPISLNLEGTKPFFSELKVSAVMGLPRVTWTANAMCWVEGLMPHRIAPLCSTGAYWEQCIERTIEKEIAEENPDVILTLDYDTVFDKHNVATLIALMMTHPEADAICPIQAARGRDGPLLWMEGEGKDGEISLDREAFAGDLLPDVKHGHFGLTMIRASKLKRLPKPWFRSVPAPDGSWGDGRRDADVAFWDAWKTAGNTLFAANRVPVGHLELMIRWPSEELKVVHQEYSEWRRDGRPKGAWS